MTNRPGSADHQVFVDTSAYYGLTDSDDSNHLVARSIAAFMASERSRPFTTPYVLAETHALMVSRLGRQIALRALTEIDHSAARVLRPTSSDEARAREILVKYHDKDSSLCDELSFAVMERHGIITAFSFDQHFLQYGFRILRAAQ